MDKLMDKLIKELRIYANDETDEIRFKAADAIERLIEERDAYRKVMTDEHNRVAKLAWEKEHCWIPVTERLPEEFENVLVANKRGKHYDIDKGWWNGSYFDRCAKSGYHSVTHWMPLPPAPKEET